jgi:hypothetical protein
MVNLNQFVFIENSNGAQLEVINKELWFCYTDSHGAQWGKKFDGYIDPLKCTI